MRRDFPIWAPFVASAALRDISRYAVAFEFVISEDIKIVV
jgi:hypothetical protein